MMKNFVLLTMFVMMAATVLGGEAKQIVYRHSARYKDGTLYYSNRTIDGAVMKTTKLEWNKFAALYPKSWICTKEAGWMLVDTPPVVEPTDNDKPKVEIPWHIHPLRDAGRGGLIIVTPTLSADPTKK